MLAGQQLNTNFKTMTKYLAIVFLITGFLVGDAYGEEDEVFYRGSIAGAGVAGTGFTGAVLHFAFPYLERH
jgi:hypothetical protein